MPTPFKLFQIPHRFLILLAYVILLFCLPLKNASAWGSGHDDVMREVIERLPSDLRESFTPEMIEEAIRHHSHYPDNFDPFLASDIGADAVAKLADAGIKRRYDLHSERGMAMAFLSLVDALQEKKAAHIALWIAAYSHVIADMAACNHDPLVHTATYGWAEWKLKLPGGEQDFSKLRPLLDLAGSAHDPAGGEAAFKAAIGQMALEDEGQNFAELLEEIMLYGQSGADFCGPRGVRVLEGAAGWIDRQDPIARKMLWKNIGELGAWAVVRTLRDVEIARRFASSEIPSLTLTPEIEANHRENVSRFIAERRITDDALFAPLLRRPADTDGPVTGIIFEPCWAMNGAMLGFASRVLSASIARNWQQIGRAFTTLDLRDATRSGLPLPEKMPCLVVVAPSFHDYHSLKAETLDQKLREYVEAGGRILWITGTGQPPVHTFGIFRDAMLRHDPKAKLPVTEDAFIGARIQMEGIDLDSAIISHPASTKAGWQQPHSLWIFEIEGHKGLRPLVSLETEGRSLTVGAIDAGNERAVLPVYAVTPHLFSNDEPIKSAHEPVLDPTSESILNAALRALTRAL